MEKAERTGIENIICTLKKVRAAAETVILSGDNKRILKCSRTVIGVYLKGAKSNERMYDELNYLRMLCFIEDTASALRRLIINIGRLGYARCMEEFIGCAKDIDREMARLSNEVSKSGVAEKIGAFISAARDTVRTEASKIGAQAESAITKIGNALRKDNADNGSGEGES